MKKYPIALIICGLLIWLTSCQNEGINPATERVSKSCDTTLTFNITGSTPYQENLIRFDNVVLDTANYPLFKNGSITTTLTGICNDVVELHRGHVFNPINTTFTNLFSSTEGTVIQTRTDNLVFGYAGWHIIRINLTSEQPTQVSIVLNEFTHIFNTVANKSKYVFLVKVNTPYYKTIKITCEQTIKVSDFQLTNFYLFDKLAIIKK
jgi:hypothetical protein